MIIICLLIFDYLIIYLSVFIRRFYPGALSRYFNRPLAVISTEARKLRAEWRNLKALCTLFLSFRPCFFPVISTAFPFLVISATLFFLSFRLKRANGARNGEISKFVYNNAIKQFRRNKAAPAKGKWLARQAERVCSYQWVYSHQRVCSHQGVCSHQQVCSCQ